MAKSEMVEIDVIVMATATLFCVAGVLAVGFLKTTCLEKRRAKCTLCLPNSRFAGRITPKRAKISLERLDCLQPNRAGVTSLKHGQGQIWQNFELVWTVVEEVWGMFLGLGPVLLSRNCPATISPSLFGESGRVR